MFSDEKGDEEVVEAEVVDFINDYDNDSYEGTIESPQSKKKIFGIIKSKKGGDFNEVLKIYEKNQFKVSEKKY